MSKRNTVNEKDVAQKMIADLLYTQAGEVAFDRLTERGRMNKQSPEEVAWRIAGNLLTSMSLDRPLF